MGHKIHKAFSCKIVVLVFLQMQNTSGASALLLQAMNWLMQDVIICILALACMSRSFLWRQI